METRLAKKAGSWYKTVEDGLMRDIDKFLAKVPETVDDSQLPIPGARIIIAP